MTTEGKESDLDKKNLKLVKYGLILNFFMFIFALFAFFHIQIPLPNFDKQEYQIYNVEPMEISHDLLFLNASPDYYVEMKYGNIRELNYGDNLSFSIETENKGKKFVEKPEYKIMVFDPLGRIRGAYPKIDKPVNNFGDLLNVSSSTFLENDGKNLNFVFKFPPVDQKVLGYWRIYVFLIDKSSNSLVSYAIQDFKVSENINSLLNSTVIIVTLISALATILSFLVNILGKKRERVKNKQD